MRAVIGGWRAKPTQAALLDRTEQREHFQILLLLLDLTSRASKASSSHFIHTNAIMSATAMFWAAPPISRSALRRPELPVCADADVV
jgi:hypothetical protein